ncbi:MAG: tyrosine--tRNA ligase [Candidatus Pacebacteria bacterium]|nr:tyrosine--tRNA ligase [Candidatus Paceibacterota bacterium]MBP9866696.1 tyrosine--tRNA ligase [Candidatus Paceibacterota bacterium]
MDKIITDEKKIDELLSRGVEDIIVKDDLKAALLSGRQLRIKFGIDPTGAKIHIGRAVPLRKLREFQKLGHQIVLIIGDFTAQVGDASDKTEKRPMITRAEIDENLKDYKSQIAKILDITKTEFVYNNDWLSKLTFGELTTLAECFSVQQMLARRNFKDRYENGTEISLREFLYPIMQGYDSVAVKADVEVGGFDQLFNLKAGRIIQEYYGMPKQSIVTFQMVEGTDGRKMSTSWGNIITIVDEPFDMFGKIMSVHDDLLIKYFILCTDVSLEDIQNMEIELKNGVNPKDIKMRLATEFVTMYHTEKDASLAKNSWIETFSKGGLPENIQEVSVDKEKEIVDILLEEGIVASKTEWRRLVDDKAVSDQDGVHITDVKEKVRNVTLKIGKKRFIKIVVI